MVDPEQTALRYLGHCSFLWTTPLGNQILIDPYANGPEENWFLRPFPRIEADVVVVTHPHFDHDNIGAVQGRPSVVRGPLDLHGEDFRVRTILGKHAGDYGPEFGQRNLICIVETGSLIFCHLGDNEASLTDDLVDEIGPVDVLFVPVDDRCHLLSFSEVDDVIGRLDPSVVIPTHHFISGLTDPASGLAGLETWLATQCRVGLDLGPELPISRASMPDRREVWCFSVDQPSASSSDSGGPLSAIALAEIHGELAMQAEAGLRVGVGAPVRMSYRSIQQGTFGQYVETLGSPSCVYSLGLSPMSRRAIVDVPTPLVFAVLGKELEWRPLMPDEMGRLASALGSLLETLASVWGHLGVESPTDIGLDTNPLRLLMDPENAVATPEEEAVWATIDVHVRSVESSITVCYLLAGLVGLSETTNS